MYAIEMASGNSPSAAVVDFYVERHIGRQFTSITVRLFQGVSNLA
jgi:hypothetical protein